MSANNANKKEKQKKHSIKLFGKKHQEAKKSEICQQTSHIKERIQHIMEYNKKYMDREKTK